MSVLTRLLRWSAIALVTAMLALVAPVGVASADPVDAASLVSQVEPGMVQITTTVDYQGVIGNGTGLILTPDGQILTNHHVVQGANSIQVLSIATGQTYAADVVGYDRDDDIALLQLRGACLLYTSPSPRDRS